MESPQCVEGRVGSLEDGKGQAALFGLLRKVCDLGLPLVSVSPVEPGPATRLGTGQADASEVIQ